MIYFSFADGIFSYDCTTCGRCCRGYGFGGWPDEIEKVCYDQPILSHFINHVTQDDGLVNIFTTNWGCTYLQNDGYCSIHVKQGYHHKPLICKLFPFAEIIRCHDNYIILPQLNCPLELASQPNPLSDHQAIKELLPLHKIKNLPMREITIPDHNAWLHELHQVISKLKQVNVEHSPFDQTTIKASISNSDTFTLWHTILPDYNTDVVLPSVFYHLLPSLQVRAILAEIPSPQSWEWAIAASLFTYHLKANHNDIKLLPFDIATAINQYGHILWLFSQKKLTLSPRGNEVLEQLDIHHPLALLLNAIKQHENSTQNQVSSILQAVADTFNFKSLIMLEKIAKQLKELTVSTYV